MLTMTHHEILETIEGCLVDNPVLERIDGHPCPGCGRHVSGGTCHRCRVRLVTREFHDETDMGVDPFRTLESQAGMEVHPDCRHALTLVVAHLTSRGLLDATPSEIARLHGLTKEKTEEAIRALRVVGPPGIAAVDVASLLGAQAEVLVVAGQAPSWLPRLVRDHLQDLAEECLLEAAEALGIPQAEVESGLALIRDRLRPFAVVETTSTDSRVPGADVLLYRNPDGFLEVEVPTSAWLGLRVADLSAGIRDAAEARAWLAEHELAARRLIRQVDGRADVLLRVTRVAVEHQREFLESGPGRHRALTRTAVAQDLGLHPSTVSRAVQGKKLRLPAGEIVDLACLFGQGVAARAALLELMTQTSGHTSDATLRDELSRRGVRIARRTVTKYRHAQHVGPSGGDQGSR
ncbi:hypothetical protein [Kocuria sabuli]|uniref:RNA polymerase factor sigma-54 n=1 Tax=Kocuria sabuli TaxID=3071448 RepID=UPI0034D5B05D